MLTEDQSVVVATEKVVLQALEAKEAELDEEIRYLESIEKNEDELEALRARRIAQLKLKENKREEWRLNGHFEYSELADEKMFFEAVKKSDFMVCHFYRPTTRRCEIFDCHFGKLSKQYIGTRFVKINAERSPYLCSNLKVNVIPTVLLIKKAKVCHRIIGFSELGARDDFAIWELESLLKGHGVINKEESVY